VRARWFVEIWSYEPDRIEKTLGPYVSERMAARAAMGANRNLDHERFYTKLRSD